MLVFHLVEEIGATLNFGWTCFRAFLRNGVRLSPVIDQIYTVGFVRFLLRFIRPIRRCDYGDPDQYAT